MQAAYGGMHRKAEFDLVLQIAGNHDFKVFLELGSGQGALLKEMKATYPHLNIVGFEILEMPQMEGVDFRSGKDIFACAKEIQDIVTNAAGPVLSYNDNGSKIKELDLVSEVMRPGDVIGCHDFGTEVPKTSVPFLKERGFTILQQYEEWINTHLCLQRFWQKI